MTPTLADEVTLPGSASRVRSALGVSGPQDVPLWMTRGGATARVAAAALAADAAVVRRAGDGVRAALFDAASALGWRGTGAEAAQAHAVGVHVRLVAVATQLDAAHDVIAGLGAALDAQRPVLGSAASSWARAVDQQHQLALVRQWQPAVKALDLADARAADALRGVASALVRAQGAVTGSVSQPAADRQGRHALDAVGRLVGDAAAHTVNGAAPLANAVGQHPESAVQLLAGLLLTEIGATGEVAGVALDATGVGAVAGVPVNMASAAAIAGGVGMMTMGAAKLGQHAAGDDHVTPVQSTSAGSKVDISKATFAQKTARRWFSEAGDFRGMTIDDVAALLRAKRLKPEDVPIDVIRRDGRVLFLNTRSSLALKEAGVPRSVWKTTDRTGQPAYERRLTNQLRNNDLDSGGTRTVRILGGR